MILFVYRLSHLARQALPKLGEISGKNSSSIVCISAPRLVDLLAKSETIDFGKNDDDTLFIAINCISFSGAMAFGGEGQYSCSIAEFVRTHAENAGSLRVVAILIAPRSDDEQQCPLAEASTSAEEAFIKNWIEQTKWPFAASAVFVPNLRNLSPADVLCALQTLPELVQWNPANENL